MILLCIQSIGVFFCAVLCLLTQSCQTLRDPMDSNLPGSFVHGDSGFSRQEYGVGCLALLQWIFPTQESNRGLLQLGWILYHQSHQERLGIFCFIKNISLISVSTILTFLSMHFQEFIFFYV